MEKISNQRIILALITIIIAQILIGCSSIDVSHDTSTANDYIRAEKAYSIQDYSLAKKHYLAVVEKYPAHINGLFRLGNISMREKKWDDAIRLYNKVIKIQPSHEKTHHNLAMLHLSLAREHLHYYIDHSNTHQNKPMGELIHAIKRYSENGANDTSSREQSSESVGK